MISGRLQYVRPSYLLPLQRHVLSRVSSCATLVVRDSPPHACGHGRGLSTAVHSGCVTELHAWKLGGRVGLHLQLAKDFHGSKPSLSKRSEGSVSSKTVGPRFA